MKYFSFFEKRQPCLRRKFVFVECVVFANIYSFICLYNFAADSDLTLSPSINDNIHDRPVGDLSNYWRHFVTIFLHIHDVLLLPIVAS